MSWIVHDAVRDTGSLKPYGLRNHLNKWHKKVHDGIMEFSLTIYVAFCVAIYVSFCVAIYVALFVTLYVALFLVFHTAAIQMHQRKS